VQCLESHPRLASTYLPSQPRPDGTAFELFKTKSAKCFEATEEDFSVAVSPPYEKTTVGRNDPHRRLGVGPSRHQHQHRHSTAAAAATAAPGSCHSSAAGGLRPSGCRRAADVPPARCGLPLSAARVSLLSTASGPRTLQTTSRTRSSKMESQQPAPPSVNLTTNVAEGH
jgi:hypothetical protein